jgi:hypothetical protein
MGAGGRHGGTRFGYHLLASDKIFMRLIEATLPLLFELHKKATRKFYSPYPDTCSGVAV